MNGVRPLVRRDIGQVAELYESMARSRTRTPAPGLAPYLERVFIDGPGIGPGTEALVYETKGRIAGFIGAHVRSFRLDREPATLVCTGPLVTDPDTRPAAALLLKGIFDGPQLLTITDGATPDALRLWERIRGHVHSLPALRWTRILRPWRLFSGHLARRRGIAPFWRPVDALGRPLLALADMATRAATGMRPAAPEPRLAAEELDAARWAEGHDALGSHYRLHPDWDAATCAWVLREMRFSIDRGPLRGRLLRDDKGRVVGWYLCYMPRGGIARVVQVAALPREYPAVLAHLLADADAQGAAAVQGRMEARLVEPLRALGVQLHYDASMSLIHSREPRVYAALLAGEAILSRAEGEWFFSFQSHPLSGS